MDGSSLEFYLQKWGKLNYDTSVNARFLSISLKKINYPVRSSADSEIMDL